MATQKKRGSSKVLIVGLVAAVVAVLIAAWKASKPIEDPWHLPAPGTAPQPPTTSNVDADDIRELAREDEE